MTPASSPPVQPATTDQKTALYQEVCNSYRALDDLRMRVLGFLPLVSGVGIIFLLNNSMTGLGSGQKTSFAQFLLPIGIVGALVTLGLFIYDLRAIQLRASFVRTGREMEHSLGIDGQFTTRPHRLFGIISDQGGSTLIYTAVIAGWVFSALIIISLQAAWIVAVVLFLFGVTGVLLSGRNEELLYYYFEAKHKGKETIPAGQTSKQISTTDVQAYSVISVMPKIYIRRSTKNSVRLSVARLSVTARVPGNSFTVELDKALDNPAKFKWWISS